MVPLLFFLRHCRINLPQNPFPWANWIIDDPNLKPRYGFLDIRELAKCVLETGAAASIAFIPWNYRRQPGTLSASSGGPKLSICVHGCDHTVSEFSTTTVSAARPLVDLAYRRMAQLERETSLGSIDLWCFRRADSLAKQCGAASESDALGCKYRIGGLSDRRGRQGARTPATGNYVLWRFSFVYETPGGGGIRKLCAGSPAREALSYRYPSPVLRRWIEATPCCRGSLECTIHDLD